MKVTCAPNKLVPANGLVYYNPCMLAGRQGQPSRSASCKSTIKEPSVFPRKKKKKKKKKKIPH